MLTWEAQRPNSCGSSRTEGQPEPEKHSFEPQPPTWDSIGHPSYFLHCIWNPPTHRLTKNRLVNPPEWRLQWRMLACGRLCRTASQRSRSRSSLRPWTEPGISFQIQIRLFFFFVYLVFCCYYSNQIKASNKKKRKEKDLGSGSHLFLLAHQLPIYHLLFVLKSKFKETI